MCQVFEMLCLYEAGASRENAPLRFALNADPRIIAAFSSEVGMCSIAARAEVKW